MVSDDDGLHEIENCWLDSDLRKLIKNKQALNRFQDVGYIEIKKHDKGQYALKSHVRGLGGGPILAVIFAGATQALCYGTAIAAATTVTAGVVAATGGTAIAPIATVAGATLTGTMGGGAASGAAAGILLAGGGQAAVGLTGAALASGSAAASAAGATGVLAGVTATVGMVNSLATAAGAIGMAIPFL